MQIVYTQYTAREVDFTSISGSLLLMLASHSQQTGKEVINRVATLHSPQNSMTFQTGQATCMDPIALPIQITKYKYVISSIRNNTPVPQRFY